MKFPADKAQPSVEVMDLLAIWRMGKFRCKEKTDWFYTYFGRILILLEYVGSYGINAALHSRALGGH